MLTSSKMMMMTIKIITIILIFDLETHFTANYLGKINLFTVCIIIWIRDLNATTDILISMSNQQYTD